MKTRKFLRSAICLIAALLFCMVLLPEGGVAKAEDKIERRKIKVAFPTQEGMSFFGHSGKVTGYNYDYLEKISEYTGWKMEYVPYGSADGNEAVGNAIQDLKDGKADLLGPLLKNAATEKLFEFPEHSYGTVYTTLCAQSSGHLREFNLYTSGKLKIGLWQTATTRNEEVLAFLNAENLDYEIVYYDSAAAQKQALIDGEVDLISSVSLSPVANTRVVANFAPRPYYFASTKGNTDLIEELDATMELIDKVEPNLQDKLYDKYFRVISDAFLLTDEQKESLASVGTLRILCAESSAPFAYKQGNSPAGILVSVLEDYAGETGLKTEYVFCSDTADARRQISEGKADILIGVPLASSACAELGFINSVAVIDSVIAYAQKPKANDMGGRVAIVKGLEEQIPTGNYGEVILCDNSKECLAAVEKGKADIAIGTRASLEYYIYETGSTLVTSYIPGQTMKASVSVSRKCDAVLLATLNNYIDSISESDLAIYVSDANLHEDYGSLALFIRKNPVHAALIASGIVLVIAAIVIFFVIRTTKQRTEMQKTHNRQLSEALQIAEEANKAKTTFLSNMSHDIRTPMNAVIGFSSLLARDPGNEVKVREYTRKIGAASNHLLGLINDILDISKIESGKISLRRSVFAIDELIESINVVVRPMAGAKRQAFNVNLGTMTHELYIGDKTRIDQILINLLSNAIKYTPQGGQIKFEIADLGQTSPSVERIRFIVADNGYGITEEFKKVIFDPFTRAENSTTNKETGTGLGLAITKNIVDLMGGTIHLESEAGRGTTFTVELPLRLPHEEEDEHFWENHKVTRMLLVDDEKSVTDGIIATMADTGVSFDTAYSGEDAVKIVKKEYAENHGYDAIILDWQMPGMNGLDTAREIRKIIPIDTPVLFLTSYDWTDIETEALEIDIDGFLAKPFTEINLKEKLIEVECFKNAVTEDNGTIDLKGMHFLLAEDNELNAEIAVELLKAEGASCDIAENGQEAVDMFVNAPTRKYDAILMDVMMPVLDGYEATKAIRSSSHPEALTIPVIAMTANAFVKDVQDALDAGMNAHIAKPVHIEVLKNTLASCIRK